VQVTAPLQPRSRALEFGIYRDGDNNLDRSQQYVLRQALTTSAADSSIEYNVQDTTSHGGFALETDAYTIADGTVKNVRKGYAHDMSSESNLARFVADTLDRAQKSGAVQTWIDLVDHGAGDGGGLEADSTQGVMSMPNIAKAIADGVAVHAQEHPEDAKRNVDGVVANQCLMASMGFVDALSHANVKYLAASPETMVSPGVPSDVAHAISSNAADPSAMAKSVVRDVMHTKYPYGSGPAAAFDVLDTSSVTVKNVENAIKTFNDTVATQTASARAEIKSDVASIQGMVRFPEATPDMPWNADRPAIALYNTIASDVKLDSSLRSDARQAAEAVANLVLAHGESKSFAPFDGANYKDAVGPTIHAPVNKSQVDPWAPKISETQNAFYKSVDQDKFVRAIA
jgi:hypothetical protein